MRDDPPLLIEFEYEQSTELLTIVLALPTTQPLCYLIHVLARAYAFVKSSYAFILRLPDRLPPYDQLLRPRGEGGERVPGVLDHALGDDPQFDVSDERNAAPRDRRGPESGGVGDAPGNGGEMRVGGGKEMESDLRGEDLLRKGRLEESWKALLEDAEG
jgi:hypothetical protein